MSRCVTFTSRRFESRTPGSHFINPGNFGEDLTLWLRARLPERFSPGDPIQEDYGWGVWARSGKDPYWVAVGKMDDDETDAAADAAPVWLVVVAYEPGFNLLRRLTHRPRREDLDALCAAIDEALQDEAQVTDVRWWEEQPFSGSGSLHP